MLLLAIIMENIDQNLKTHCRTDNIKMENNEIKIIRIKNFCTPYYFDAITKFQNFDSVNIL